jgi:hypothetical protein
MKLWMSGEVQADIAEPYRITSNAIEAEVNRLLATASLETQAREWDVISIILDERISNQYPEVAKKSARGQSLEFRLSIPHAEFLEGSPSQRTSLIFGVLSRSVVLMGKGVSLN